MIALKRIYGKMIIGAMLLAGCSHDSANDEILKVPASAEGQSVAISFDCQISQDNTQPTRSGYTGDITQRNKQLYYSGFGVFAGRTGEKPDLMYNQEVEYVFKADVVADGYWTYSPIKYWPYSLANLYLCAYAPYVASPDALSEGICAMSGNAVTGNPYIEYRRCGHPEDNVDLLWGYIDPDAGLAKSSIDAVGFKSAAKFAMHHALARVQVCVTLDNASSGVEGKKVLLREVKLSGSMAQTGRLDLTGNSKDGDVPYPTWTGQSLSATDIRIKNTDFPNSYGRIAEDVRFLEDLPYRWQPDGLTKNEMTNVLCMGDYPSYVYLIPQASLSLTCTVYYTLMASDNSTTEGLKTVETPVVISPLKGNRTYTLNLKIRID